MISLIQWYLTVHSSRSSMIQVIRSFLSSHYPILPFPFLIHLFFASILQFPSPFRLFFPPIPSFLPPHYSSLPHFLPFPSKQRFSLPTQRALGSIHPSIHSSPSSPPSKHSQHSFCSQSLVEASKLSVPNTRFPATPFPNQKRRFPPQQSHRSEPIPESSESADRRSNQSTRDEHSRFPLSTEEKSEIHRIDDRFTIASFCLPTISVSFAFFSR